MEKQQVTSFEMHNNEILVAIKCREKENEVGFDYFVEEKNIYNVDRNIGGVVGCNKGTINNIPEGILENMLKRLEILETKTKNL